MATNDLMAELQKDSIKLDDDSERKVSKAIFGTFFFFLKALRLMASNSCNIVAFCLQRLCRCF